MILPAQKIAELQPISPMEDRRKAFGMTYGLGPAGYDVRIDQDITLYPVTLGNLIINAIHSLVPWLVKKRPSFALASTMERFDVPDNLTFKVEDKSTWARRGLGIGNTTAEPSWTGWLTLELNNHGEEILHIKEGMPIAQVVFHRLEEPTRRPYTGGKYDNQPRGPQPAILES